MDHRGSWPWKKKLSERTIQRRVVEADSVVASLDSSESQGYQKKMNSVEIPMESDAHVAELENEIKTLNDQVKILTQRLSSVHSETTIKDDLINQHVRVSEEAVAGWEKTEAEVLELKNQLEECMKQMQNTKEEYEQKLHETVLVQTKQWEKIKLELDTKIDDLDGELRKSSDENDALSRLLQERSDMLMKANEEKSQAITEVNFLKSKIETCEREISSLNYELHMVYKELEIHNGEKNMNVVAKVGDKNNFELMDNFKETERLAFSTECSGALSMSDSSDSSTDKRTETEDHKKSFDTKNDSDLSTKKQSDLDPSQKHVSCNEESSVCKLGFNMDPVTLSEIQSRISMILESEAKEVDLEKILQDIKYVLQNIQAVPPQHSVNCISEEIHSLNASSNEKDHPLDNIEALETDTSLDWDDKPGDSAERSVDRRFATAIFHIHDFVKSMSIEATAIQDESTEGDGIRHRFENFFHSIDEVLCSKMSVVNFVIDLSYVLAKANLFGYRSSAREFNSFDCLDNSEIDCANVSHLTSDLEVLREGYSSPPHEWNASWECLLEELEQLKSEKDNLDTDLARCTEDLESANFQLQQTKQLNAELKSQLATSQKYNSLTETQLKCMAESYKSLEKREQDLQAEVNLLCGRAQILNDELQQEKRNHEDALDKSKDLQEQLHRTQSCPMCSRVPVIGADIKSNQEREIIAATEKLAECQENIFILDRQLKALRPPRELKRPPRDERRQTIDPLMDFSPLRELKRPPRNERRRTIDPLVDFNHHRMKITSANIHKEGGESPSSCSVISSESPKLRRSNSGSMSSSLILPKHGYGFSRLTPKPMSSQ